MQPGKELRKPILQYHTVLLNKKRKTPKSTYAGNKVAVIVRDGDNISGKHKKMPAQKRRRLKKKQEKKERKLTHSSLIELVGRSVIELVS